MQKQKSKKSDPACGSAGCQFGFGDFDTRPEAFDVKNEGGYDRQQEAAAEPEVAAAKPEVAVAAAVAKPAGKGAEPAAK